jgi:hypothetical protein
MSRPCCNGDSCSCLKGAPRVPGDKAEESSAVTYIDQSQARTASQALNCLEAWRSSTSTVMYWHYFCPSPSLTCKSLWQTNI